jgi:hypothetical protein
MIKSVDNVTLDTVVEVGQITDHSGNGIHLASDGHLDYIVMTMTVGIAALAVNLAVFFLAISLRVQTVRGAEDISSGQISSHASP